MTALRRCRPAAVAAVLLAVAGAGPTTQPAPAPPTTGSAAGPATAPTVARTLFDPARHMRVADVRPGMKGYGLSVFLGEKISRFDVEVISVLHHFNPKTDVILIRFAGDGLESATAVAGMSGSPIYLYDDAGTAKMVGAFAYGWTMQKEPIAGVQPIEYMLELPAGGVGTPPTTRVAADAGAVRWSLADAAGATSASRVVTRYTPWQKPPVGVRERPTGGLRPLATPLSVAGLSPRAFDQIAPLLREAGLNPVQGGGGGGGGGGGATRPVKAEIAPGSVLGVQLVGGDVDLSEIGTCTEVVGDHVVAFGHPMNGEGAIALPFGGGAIQGVVANYASSFKLGSIDAVRGTLTNDTTVGVAGTLGAAPALAPVDLRVRYADGSEDQAYHFTVVRHPKLTPVLVGAALASALTGAKELPDHQTVDYDVTLEFDGGRTLRLNDSSVDVAQGEIFGDVGTPVRLVADNPYGTLALKRITGTMTISPTARSAQLLYATLPRSRYRPGETVSATATVRPFRGADRVLPVRLTLPKDLPDGTYQLTVSDWQKYLEDERTAEPFRFTAESLDGVFDALRTVTAVRHDAVYVRLLRQSDGVAIGHVALPKLPGSRRQILVGSGRSDVTAFVSSVVAVVPTDRVMSGSAEFELTVDKNADTAENAGRLPHRDGAQP